MTLREAANEAIDNARLGRVQALSRMVDSLRFKGLTLNGQRVRFTYADLVTFFSRGRPDLTADEFETLMEQCDTSDTMSP